VKQAGRGSEVCEEPEDKGQAGEGETDDGQVLEVPAVGVVDGVGVVVEPFERVDEGGETEELEG